LEQRLGQLTRGERAALDAASGNLTQRDAARLLGISRRTYRDRLARVGRCFTAERNAHDRTWALRLALCRSRVGDIENAEILRLYAAGRSVSSIALEFKRTPGAIKQRVHRFRTAEAVGRP